MKKLVIMTLALMMSLSAKAGVISLELDDSNVSVGDIVQVSVIGTGFDAFDTLNVDIEFDTSLFSVDELSLGGDLFSASPLDTYFSAQVFGAAFSFLSFDVFAGGDFTIATFNITAIADGASDFMLTNALASDFFFGPVDADISSDQVSAKVSSPATIGLFALAGLLMLRLRKTSN